MKRLFGVLVAVGVVLVMATSAFVWCTPRRMLRRWMCG
jgi:hypothetical protein